MISKLTSQNTKNRNLLFKLFSCNLNNSPNETKISLGNVSKHSRGISTKFERQKTFRNQYEIH